MTGPGGIEFLDPEPDPHGDGHGGGEGLDTGPRQPVPRWVIGLVGIAIAAAIVVVLTLNNGGAPTAAPSSAHPASTASTRSRPPATVSSAPATSSTQSVVFVPGPLVARVIALKHGPVQAMAFTRDGLAVLEPGYLSIIDPASGSVRGSAVLGEIGDVGLGPWRLFADGRVMWAVGGGHVYRLNPNNPEDVKLYSGAGAGGTATVLDGRLYLAALDGVYVLRTDATRAKRVVKLSGIQAIAADPARHRLLVLARDNDTVSVRAYTPGKPHVPRAGVRLSINSGSGNLVVVQAAIWATGYNNDHGRVLLRLNPHTLAAIDTVPTSQKLGSDARLAGSGEADFWLRGAGGLWCISHTGEPAQHWPFAAGAVTSRPNQAFAAIDDQIAQLRLNDACAG